MPSPACLELSLQAVISAHLCLEEKPHHRAAGVQGSASDHRRDCWESGRVRSPGPVCVFTISPLALGSLAVSAHSLPVCLLSATARPHLSAGFRHALGCGAQVATGLCLPACCSWAGPSWLSAEEPMYVRSDLTCFLEYVLSL